ncbi:transcription elongation factor spt5 [Rhizophlyctis rosea]|uniref:Transcription elongation factor SPT5 n=1 Tax=Rhizophlyctis rosea TaxID=64517 RepID=A0AAD5SAQ7_9FUNG|nr:transcription elongation factor spt5 [Rhizophlyctis rosea]
MSDDERESRDRRRDEEEEVDEDEEIDEDEEERDEDEEDEEEEDEDEDEDEEGGGRARKRRRKQKASNPFIETEAAVDTDDEEEEDEDEGYGLDRDEDFDEEVGKTYLDTRAHRELDRRQEEDDSMTNEEVAARLKEKYGRQERARYTSDIGATPHAFLLPAHNEKGQTNLWMAKCKPGKEKDVIFALMGKFDDWRAIGKSPEIHSAFYRDGLQGYIYLEASSSQNITRAIDQVPNLYPNSMKIIPMEEMAACLTIKSKESDIQIGQWVRVKRGVYQGDLGKVQDISEGGDMITVRLIPRFDLDKGPKDQSNKRKKFDARPPQKVVPMEEYKHDMRRDRGGPGLWIFRGEKLDAKGYLEKEFKLSGLDVEGISPSLDELSKFEGASNDGGDTLERLANARLGGAQFTAGETVEVTSGDLMHTTGTVQSVTGTVVTVLADAQWGLRAPFEVEAHTLRKKFKAGDFVRVANGTHKDETGMVVDVQDNIVTVLTDTGRQPVSAMLAVSVIAGANATLQIQVFSKDLRPASDVASSAPAPLSRYQVNDLAIISPTEAGVVLKVEPDQVTILNVFGHVQRVKPGEIRSKRDASKKVVTSGQNGATFTIGDDVSVNDPGMPGVQKKGTVLHIFRIHAFLHSREYVENNGVFVARCNTVVPPRKNVPDRPQYPAYTPTPGYASQGGPGMNGGPRGPGGGRGGPPRGRGGRNQYVGKDVKILKGPWKGYQGIITDCTDKHARVELHTASKLVTIEWDKIFPDAAGVNGGPMNNNYGQAPRYDRGGFTPSGAKTPMHGGRTPMHRSGDGGRTPNPYDGSRTPAWDAGSQTPAVHGSRASAWDLGSKTPGPSNDYESGGRSSAWDASSRTPHRLGTEYSNPYTPSPAGGRDLPYSGFLADSPAPTESPYNASSQFDRPTPQEGPATPYNPNTPGPWSGTPAPGTPYGGSGHPTGDSDMYYGDEFDDEDWIARDIEVEITRSKDGNSFRSGALDRKRAVVTQADQSQSCTIKLLDATGEQIRDVPVANLKLVEPNRKDPVKIVGGQHKGREGFLFSLDGEEAVVKNPQTGDIVVTAMKDVARKVAG